MSATRLGVRHALVGGEVVPGDVELGEDGRIAAAGLAPGPGATGLAAPGFVDLQVNGFAGVDALAAEPADLARAGAALAATGVTTWLPTFVSSPEDDLVRALGAAREARRAQAAPERAGPVAAAIAGVHLEGPFLSPRWPGAHDPRHLRAPDPALADRLLAAGDVALMTLAPELPGALDLVAGLAARGVVVSCGHSDADAAAAHAGYDAGARSVTHVHNAHRRWAHRDPGLGGVALVRGDVVVMAIVDGVHLAPEAALLAALAARGRFALVTDAMEAAGLGDGTYRLGARTVEVRGAEARLPDGTFAGSVLTMDGAVRELVGLGVAQADALRAASEVPARLLGRPDLGVLAPGGVGDVVVLDDRLEVIATYVGGRRAEAETGV